MATKIEVLKATILSLGGSFDDIDATDEAALSKRLIEVCGKLQNPGGGSGGSGLPTGGEPYQQLVTDGEGNAVWEDRLAYDEGYVDIVPETALISEEEGMWNLLGTTPLNVVPGEAYTVTYNGTTYNLTAGEINIGNPMPCLGNAVNLGGVDTGEPFLVVIAPSEIVLEQGMNLTLMNTDGATAVTLSISHGSIRTIDEKFLPASAREKLKVYAEEDAYTENAFVSPHAYKDAACTTMYTYNELKEAGLQGFTLFVKHYKAGGYMECAPMAVYPIDASRSIAIGLTYFTENVNGIKSDWFLLQCADTQLDLG